MVQWSGGGRGRTWVGTQTWVHIAALVAVLPGRLEVQGLLGGRRPRAYTLPGNTVLQNGQVYDYIVAGAGAGGCAVAARLAQAGARVLLLEAGGDPGPLTKVPAAAMALLGSDIDWQYPTIPNNKSCLASLGRQCRFARGKCLGGSTAINYMLYTRGNRKDYDDIKVPGWSYRDLLPYFLKYEGLQDLDLLPESSRPYHNTNGIMRIGFFDDSENPWHDRLMSAYESLKFPFNPDVNAASEIGFGKLIGYVRDGERMSTARAYLSRADVKKNLAVARNTRCTGVILNNNNVARGVTAVQGSTKLNLYARKEVILSAGTIGTPQILLLSGIGPADHLQSMGIPVKLNLPVGENMTDHALPLVVALVDSSWNIVNDLKQVVLKVDQFAQLLISNNGPLTSNGLTDLGAFVNSNCYDFERRRLLNVSTTGHVEDCQLPNLQMIHAYVDRGILPLAKPVFQHAIGFNDDIIDQLAKANEEHAFIIISPVALQPKSVGRVRLATTDPHDKPAIFPNYLDHDQDLDTMVKSLKIVEDLVETKPFKRRKAKLLRLRLAGCPSYEADRSGYWRCYARHMTYAVYHAAGTCALGGAGAGAGAGAGVLDARLRVRGVRRLRVADLSALPYVPRANTEAVAVAIGERCFDFIMEENKGSG